MFVFVLDTNRKTLDPCSPARARKLLTNGRASVFRRYPFTIIIHGLELEKCETREHRLKIDPGAKTTEFGSGGLTKYNRCRQNLEKSHWLDASCVGNSTPEKLIIKVSQPLIITATGHDIRQRIIPDKYGFARGHRPRIKQFFGFQTGGLVVANVLHGKKAGRHNGRVACRKTGSFNIQTATEVVQGISYRYCTAIYKCDGYQYQAQATG